MFSESLVGIMDLFCCPRCFGKITTIGTDDSYTKITDDFYCSKCDCRYPIFGDIPFFIDINKSGWVSLNLAKKLWGKTDRRIPFNEFVFMLEEISSPTLAYEDMGRKAIAYSSLEACNFHKKLINDYAEWNTSTKPLYDFVIKKTVELSTANSIILDVGIGAGELELDLARVVKSKIIGLDKDPAFTVSKIWSSEPLENSPIAICGDIRKTPFRNNSIDIILSTGGLTSVYKVGEALIEIQRIIKHNGYFIFSDFIKVNQKETQEEIQGSLGQLKNLGFITEEIIENVCNGLSVAVMKKTT